MPDELAKHLRANATDAEKRLRSVLREARRAGLHFRRQVRIGTYIVDFACHHAKVVVELDGSPHGEADAVAYDEERTAFLERRGYQVVRFWNREVYHERDRVLDAIIHFANAPRDSAR